MHLKVPIVDDTMLVTDNSVNVNDETGQSKSRNIHVGSSYFTSTHRQAGSGV